MPMSSSSIISVVLVTAAAMAQDSPLTYVDTIKPIFQDNCIGCHRQGRAKNGLRLDDYNAMLQGGSAGPAIVKGNPDNSLLYLVMAHESAPFMPKGEAKLDDGLIETVRTWIAEGARATKDDASFVPQPAAPAMTLDVSALAAPDGAPAMPSGVQTDPYWWSAKPNTINAIATSPFAPLVAIGGFHQVLLHDTTTLACVGVLDFPEGDIHSLRFSRDGTLLLAGGGRGATSGRVVAWSVANGERVLELGKESDLVLSADISEDHGRIVLGGPEGTVRVLDASTGDVLHELQKHTDWITAASFSPDGILLATGDRAGNVHVWETWTGREFSTPPAHGGRITALAWRGDSQLFASTSADGRIRLIDAERGREQRTWTSHNGVLAAAFDRSGHLATAGRDGRARLWAPKGKQKAQTEPLEDEATALGVSADGERLIVGSWRGGVRLFSTTDGGLIGELKANPITSYERLVEETDDLIATLQTNLAATETLLVQSTAEADGKRTALAAAKTAAEAALAEAIEAENVAAEQQPIFERATALLDSIDALVPPKKTALEEAAALMAQAEEALEERRAKLTKAIAHEAKTEADHVVHSTEETRAALDLAVTLRAGAEAIATEAAVLAARHRTAHEAAAASVRQWNDAIAVDRGAATMAIDKARLAFELHERLQLDADRLETLANDASMAVVQVEETAASLGETKALLQSDLARAETTREQAGEQWTSKRIEIEAARGLVN